MSQPHARQRIAASDTLPVVGHGKVGQIIYRQTRLAHPCAIVGIFGTVEYVFIQRTHVGVCGSAHHLASPDHVPWMRLKHLVALALQIMARPEQMGQLDPKTRIRLGAELHLSLRRMKGRRADTATRILVDVCYQSVDCLRRNDSVIVQKHYEFGATAGCTDIPTGCHSHVFRQFDDFHPLAHILGYRFQACADSFGRAINGAVVYNHGFYTAMRFHVWQQRFQQAQRVLALVAGEYDYGEGHLWNSFIRRAFRAAINSPHELKRRICFHTNDGLRK